MRMWNVDPEMLCRQHLLGEHVEMHMFGGCLDKGKSLSGYVLKGLVELENLRSRHDVLVSEMKRRGYNHNSPFHHMYQYIIRIKGGKVNEQENKDELARRCPECRKRLRSQSSLPPTQMTKSLGAMTS